MRFFLTLAYKGTRYCGWQRQPESPSVQETLETALQTLLRTPTEITGCGRTDTGVHARYFVAHFDADGPLPEKFIHSLNSILPPDIAVGRCSPVHQDAHARFDAFERAYRYTIALSKDPFSQETAWYFPHGAKLPFEKLQETADLLPPYAHFLPFCKAHSGADHYQCALNAARWEASDDKLVFHISANRFLRGMVRLIVGACINVAWDKIPLGAVETALERQEPLPISFSVPAEGLALTDVKYPFPF